MVYVDLNPVRASMANTPEASDYTSIKARISDPDKEKQLLPLVGSKTFNPETPCPTTTLSFGWADYLELVDWTGRSIRDDKRGAIDSTLPPILSRLNLDADQWLKQHALLEKHYPSFMGHGQKMKIACEKLKQKWNKGLFRSRLLFG